MDFFDVYVLRFDVNEERATRALMQVFGLSEAAARIFVHSVPRVGKRNVPTDTAERYVRALHAVGAVVECRRSGSAPLGENANRVQPMSLPAPATSTYPGVEPPHIMQDSLGVMAPLQYSPDMPQIPKAPRVPADLHAIRSRKGPDSLAPNWRSTEQALISSSAKGIRGPSPQPGGAGGRGGGGLGGGGGGLGGGGLEAAGGLSSGAAAGGAIWEASALQISSDPLRQSPFNRKVSPEPFRSDETPERTDRVDHAGLEGVLSSPTPLSPSPFAPSRPGTIDDEPTPWFANATHQLLLACLIIGGMVLAMSSGVFETDAARRGRTFQEAGIQPGDYEAAVSFLGRPDNQFEGIGNDELKAMIDGMTRAGAKTIWVSNIAHQGNRRTSHTLLVELPDDPTARRTLFEQHLKNPNARRPAPQDTGQRIVSLAF